MAQAATMYDGTIKELVRRFKFDHVRAAYKPLATLIAASLPSFTNNWTVVPIPTAAAHIRQRGYDHARLLAKEVAKQKGLPLVPLLRRTRDQRQVGANRAGRQAQTKGVFESKNVVDKKILLIDDVCTTGATLSAAAAALKEAGATEVWAAVAAWQQPKSHKKKDR